MRLLRFATSTLGAVVCIGALSGCGSTSFDGAKGLGAQSWANAVPAGPRSAYTDVFAAGDLLYASSAANGDVYVYTYPGLKSLAR